MSQIKMKLGQQVKKLRTQAGFSQEELAEKAGISVDFLSLIERGKNAPSIENLEKLAKSLGVPMAELFN